MSALTVARSLAESGLSRLEARLLLEYVTGFDSARVLARPEHVLSSSEAARYGVLCARRQDGEPIAYLVGRREFYGLDFEVSPAVLIPRPETELLVERAEPALSHGKRLVLDLGTGSGAIAIAVARRFPDAEVWATDASAAAIELARRNAQRHGVRIRFIVGDWFEAVVDAAGEQRFAHRFDVIVSNPPYIAASDHHLRAGDVRFEPALALVGGADGLDAIRRIVAGSSAHLLPRGQIWIEHGHDQAGAVSALLRQAGFRAIETWPDLAGIPRVTGGSIG